MAPMTRAPALAALSLLLLLPFPAWAHGSGGDALTAFGMMVVAVFFASFTCATSLPIRFTRRFPVFFAGVICGFGACFAMWRLVYAWVLVFDRSSYDPFISRMENTAASAAYWLVIVVAGYSATLAAMATARWLEKEKMAAFASELRTLALLWPLMILACGAGPRIAAMFVKRY